LHLDGSPYVIRLQRSLYGTSMPGAGAVHHIKSGKSQSPKFCRMAADFGQQKVNKRTRSKWSRVLRYAAEHKTSAEPLAAFIQRKGGINKCAERFTRCLGRGGQY
jgi:hypothetical protein